MRDDPPAGPSLASRLAAAVSGGGGAQDRRSGLVVALLLAAAPAAVWAGARWTEAGVRRDIAAVRATAAPRLELISARGAARTELAALLATPGAAATLDGLAQALPRDASLVQVGRTRDRRLTVEVAAADPDRLRAALRRAPATARLRDVGQRRGDGGMTVTLEEAR